MAATDSMETMKKIWDLYSVKLALALGLAAFIGRASKIDLLGGTVLVCLVVYYFIRSFKDPALKKKKAVTRECIYILLAVFLLAGLVVMSGSSDSASQSIRSQISNSLVK